jgi:hypothetical protein
VEAEIKVETTCREIGEHLKELAHARARGLISEERFVGMVLKIEAEQVRPHGLVLTASNTRDDWTVFKLRFAHSHETCATFEFLPETGEFRRVGSGPP